MSDDKTQSGAQDRLRINLSEDYEVRDRTAVGKVGNMAADVERELKGA